MICKMPILIFRLFLLYAITSPQINGAGVRAKTFVDGGNDDFDKIFIRCYPTTGFIGTAVSRQNLVKIIGRLWSEVLAFYTRKYMSLTDCSDCIFDYQITSTSLKKERRESAYLIRDGVSVLLVLKSCGEAKF